MRLGSRSSSPGTVNARAFSRWNVSHFYNTFQQHQFNVNQFNLHLGSKSMIYNGQPLTFPADEAAEEPKPSLSVSTLSSTAPGRSVASAARVSKTWMLFMCIATTRISKQYSYSMVILERLDYRRYFFAEVSFK